MNSGISLQWQRVLVVVAMLSVLSVLGGCASGQRAPDERDPLEGMNRAIYGFNSGLDDVLIHPVVKGYKAVLPQPARTGVSNFFGNLGDFVTIVNDILQGKFQQGLEDGSRVVWNTTLGIGGLFDPATSMGLPKHREDFGQTLGVWFSKDDPGPYLVLPILGPSSFRDGIGLIGDIYTWPVIWLTKNPYVTWVSATLSYIDIRSQLSESEDLLATAAVDPYAFYREGYFQHRRNLVWDGNAPETEDDTFDDDFDPTESAAPTAEPAMNTDGKKTRLPAPAGSAVRL